MTTLAKNVTGEKYQRDFGTRPHKHVKINDPEAVALKGYANPFLFATS